MDQWIANARADIEELFAEASRLTAGASLGSDDWLRVPAAWRCIFQALQGMHAFLVFFARPGFFGGGALLAVGLLFGSPPEALILNDVVIVAASAVVLWTKHKNICGSWRAYLQASFGATVHAEPALSRRPQRDARIAKPPLLLSAILWASVGLSALGSQYFLSTRGSSSFCPHNEDYYVVPKNDSVDSAVTSAELRRRITALVNNDSEQRRSGEVSAVADEDSVSPPDQRDYNYSLIIRGLINGVIVGTVVVAWLMRWLDKRRW